MGLLDDLASVVGPAQVLQGAAMRRYADDWMGKYHGAPLAVVRPADTAQVAACVRLAAAAGVAVVPVSGNTGLVGGTMTEGGLMISLERMNRIRALRPDARLVVAEAGVILQTIHEAAETQGLYFPLWFGARGSAQLGAPCRPMRAGRTSCAMARPAVSVWGSRWCWPMAGCWT